MFPVCKQCRYGPFLSRCSMSGLPFVIRAGDSSHEGILENNALLERRCPVFVSVSDREIASPCRGGNEKRKRKRLTLLRRL
jgi:hypothetical protein